MPRPLEPVIVDPHVSRQALCALRADHPYRALGDGSYVPQCVTDHAAWALAEPLAVQLLACDDRVGGSNLNSRRSIVCRWVYELAVDDPDLLTIEFALDDWEITRLLPTYLKSGASRTAHSVLRTLRDGFPTVFAKAPVVRAEEHSLAPVTDEQVAFALQACDGLQQPAEANVRALLHACAGAGLDGPDLRHATGRHVQRRSSGVWVEVDWGNHRRAIPVRAIHAEPLAALAEARGELLLVANTRAPCHTSTAGNASKKINHRIGRVRGEFTVSPERLRKNWLVAMIRQGMPYDVLMSVAGVDSLRPIERLIREHLEPTVVSEDELAQYFR